MDQMRPEYVDVFDMDNVRGLIEDGVNYEDAYLGHMGSETVITHNVLATGVLPKNMGWSDEVQRDVDNVLGGIDKIGHMWGGITDTGSYPALQPGARELHRQERRRAARPPDRRARGERSARRDADRPHHGPRREPGAQLPRDQRPQTRFRASRSSSGARASRRAPRRPTTCARSTSCRRSSGRWGSIAAEGWTATRWSCRTARREAEGGPLRRAPLSLRQQPEPATV